MTTINNIDYLSNNQYKNQIEIKEKLHQFSNKALTLFKNNWIHADRAMALSRYLIGVILNSGALIAKGYAKTEKALKDTTTHFKILVIVNVPFNLASLPSSIKNIWQSIQWKDREGVAHASISFSLIAGALYDDITTSVNAILQAASNPGFAWISRIGIPFGLALTSTIALTKCIHLHQLAKFNRELNKQIQNLDLDIEKCDLKEISTKDLQGWLSPFLEKHLGEETSIFKERNQNILKRHTSEEVVNQMKKLDDLIHSPIDDTEIRQIVTLLKGIKTSLKDETILQSTLLVAAIVSAVGWSLFFTPAAPVAPFVLLTIGASMQLGVRAYHHWKVHHRRKCDLETLSINVK